MAGSRDHRAVEAAGARGQSCGTEDCAPVIKADPDDDRILECAVAGGADLIVSGDHHLTRLKNFEGIGIVRLAYFLKILG
jgi:predicted nucleic acid-binding protein